MHSPSLYLAQYADNSMYSTTLTILNGWDPVEVLLSDTAEGSALHNVIRSEVSLWYFTSHPLSSPPVFLILLTSPWNLFLPLHFSSNSYRFNS